MAGRICIMDHGRVAQVGALRVADAILLAPFPLREGTVTLGIRPEDLEIAADGALRGEVVAVEPLGAETILALRLPGSERDLLLRAGRNATAALGETIGVGVPASALHLFDASTRRRIDPEGASA